METKFALMPLTGEDTPDALALFTFTPQVLLDLRSARKLVLDHNLLEIHIATSDLNPVQLVDSEPSEAHADANPALDEAFAEAQGGGQGLVNAPAEVADAATAYVGDPAYGAMPRALAVVVTPSYLWVEFGYKYSNNFESQGLDLDELLGKPDEDNA